MRRAIAGLLALALIAGACGDDDETVSPTSVAPSTTSGIGFIASSVERIVDAPQSGDLDETTAGGRAFAYDLYGTLATGDGNLAFSPLSIRLALAMTFAGAAGDTADQMAQALRFTLPADRLHRTFNALDRALDDRNIVLPPGPADEERKVELSIANALWGQRGFAFEAAFLDLLAAEYGAGMNVVDFADDTEGTRQEINQWVADATRDRIPELIQPGVLSALTRLVLTNAVYLNATWETPFSIDNTIPGEFTRLDGTTVTADMMHEGLPASYAAASGWQAVELPYVGGDLAMTIIVPDAGDFARVEAALGDVIEAAVDALEPSRVALALPRFEFRSQMSVVGSLQALGMIDAFDQVRADFTGMTGARDLFVSDVVHEAFISVDEAGTEAAAATAVIMDLRAIAPSSIVLEIDRPFLFALRDRPTGEILFLGRVLDPTG